MIVMTISVIIIIIVIISVIIVIIVIIIIIINITLAARTGREVAGSLTHLPGVRERLLGASAAMAM